MPGVQPKVGDEPGGGQAGDLVERAGLFERVSGAGHDLRRCSVASRDDGTNDLLVGDVLRTNELQEWR